MARMNRTWPYGALLIPVLLGGCTGPIQALDCITTRLEGHGTNYRELDITLKVRDKNGQVSEQKKYKLCHYAGTICYASGAVHRWETLSPASSLEISTQNGQAVYYSPKCDELTPGSLRFTDAFFVDQEAGQTTESVGPGQSLEYAKPSLTGGDALATYGMQVVGIKISARFYDYEWQAKGREWNPVLSWGYP